MTRQAASQDADMDIAIVGMAAHLPDAPDIGAFWRNLASGTCSIRRRSEADLLAAGEDPGLMRHRDYVPFAAPLDGFDRVDAEFFGLSPKEAAVMDPQHRRFLEVSWEALEHAGHVPDTFDGRIGVYAGCGMGSYFYFNVCSNRELVDATGMFLLRHTGNDKDFLSTRLSNVLDLRGPSVNLQTACSTSLVAVHHAVQALQSGECDMALAGGVTIEIPHGRGYLYRENEILSPDGACRAFDHRAQGTVFGSGAAVVTLRRLSDALADGDHVWAVIKGSAINNDGAKKAGYLAPSVDGQAEAVAEALAVAGVTADTVDYVECHGTGTYLGDPIEIAALTQAFRRTSDAVGHCRVGSVKTNIGHLDTAAGTASLIKAALALHHRTIPPSLGFEAPNPAIGFDGSPFLVADRAARWPRRGHPRRAGVNSLGVGGTNAHVVLEEAPERAAPAPAEWPYQILTLSARGKGALDDGAARLAAHLNERTDQPLADIAWTLKEGRHNFDRRMVLVAGSHAEAARLLSAQDPRRVHVHQALSDPDTVFLFPGGGVQYAGMARDLYQTEPVFADWMDRGLAHLATLTDRDMHALWLPEPGQEEAADAALRRPSLQLPLIMIVEYALAQMWMAWGVRPAALAGHSMGENTAACVAGVIGFEDCIGLVHLRGSLFDTVPTGGMLAVSLPAESLRARLGDALDLAAVNAAGQSVASGPKAALDALRQDLEAEGIDCQPVAIDIAAHSRMLDPILERFRAHVETIPLSPPRIPLMSNLTGAPMTDAQATDPDYWVDHLRGTVQFADCIDGLTKPNRIFLEVGPGNALTALARLHEGVSANQVLASLRHPKDPVADDRHLLEVLGRIWALGGRFDWAQIWGEAPRARVPLPTYAFQRQRYFIEPGRAVADPAPALPARTDDMTDWGWRPVWLPRPAAPEVDVTDALSEAARASWLFFADEAGIAAEAAARLRAAGHTVIEVTPGDSFARAGDTAYRIAPEQGREGYDRLLQDLDARGLLPDRIAHFWLLTEGTGHRPGSSFFHRVQEQGFYALLFLAQALGELAPQRMPTLTVVTNGAVQVKDEPLPMPEKATAAGPVRVIPRELAGMAVGTLDVELPARPRASAWRRRAAEVAHAAARYGLVLACLEELLSPRVGQAAAVRGGRRFESRMRRVPLGEATLDVAPGDTVLMTGGFGGVGLSLAHGLAARGANLVLVARAALPPRDEWDSYLSRRAPHDRVARRIRAVLALEAAGVGVMVAAGDVSRRDRMAEIRAEAEARFGRITGIVHAAGVIRDAPLMTKSPAAIEDVFTPKIHGTQVLDAVFPDGSVDWIALFSSSSTVIAPAGQVDYIAANAFLDAFAAARTGGRTRVRTINWGIWNEVGMAAEAVAARSGDVPEVPVTPVALPLLDRASFDAAGNRVFLAEYGMDDWLVAEHRTQAGEALLPGASNLSLAAHALHAHRGDTAFELRDLDLLRPLRVDPDRRRQVKLRLRRNDEGYDLDILSDAEVGGRAGMAPISQARLSLLPMPAPAPLDLAAIRRRLGPAETAGDRPLTAPQAAQMRFGPRWQVLRSRAFGEAEGLAELALGPEARGDGCLVHPALLDIATTWALPLVKGWAPDRLWVPVQVGRVRVFAPLPDTVVSWVHGVADSPAETGTARYDVTLARPDGTVVMQIEGFVMRRIDDASIFQAPPRIAPSEIEFAAGRDAAQPLSPSEERLAHLLSQGIRPDEGFAAFRRAMAMPHPRVVVSSMDLDALTAQAAEPVEAEGALPSFDRPELESEFVAPETEIEKTLAGFWSELLGVSQVGALDSFFDLGGHSLIAVRLFARVRKTFRVDFPISILFEAPTIRACAALIEEQLGGDIDKPAEAPAQPKPPQRRFTHLVPMHDGDGGPRTPFFLIAGMFGNVLNLRHLANLLGSDRPFYGVQARGLYGGAAPHATIEDAARDYIAEMRRVQPEGPYMIGGFSGGGITAYEVAQQLNAAGQEVSLLVMLDTPLPQRRRLEWRDRLLIQLAQAREGGLRYPVTWARNRIAWEIRRRRAPEQTADDHSFHNAEIEAAFYHAVAAYRPRPWNGRLVLYRPPMSGRWTVSGGRLVNADRAYVIHDNEWGRYVPDVAVVEVPGDHDSMVLEPNVRVLATRMRTEIEHADANRSDTGAVVPFARRTQAAE